MRSLRRMPVTKFVMLAICALLASSALSVFAGGSARATDSWPVTVPYSQRAEQVTARPDGAVTVSKCSWGGDTSQTTAFSTYGSDGSPTGSTDSTSSGAKFFCGATMAVGANGWTYGYKLTDSFSTYTILGYQNGVEQWSYLLPSACTGFSYAPSLIGMTLGADGDLYVLYESSPCGDARVLKVDTATYQVSVAVSLAPTPDGYYKTPNTNNIVAYRDGFVVRYGNYKFRYFSYAGVEDVSKYYEVTPASGQSVSYWGLNYDGDIFVALDGTNYSRTGSCQIATVVEGVIKRTPANLVTTYDLEAQCMRLQDFGVTPGGGAALTSNYDATPNASSLVLLGADGSVQVPAVPMATGYQASTYQAYYVQVGINGNVLLTRQVQSTSTYRTVSEFNLFGPSGDLLAREQATALYNAQSNYDYMVTAEPDMANGYVFTSLCERSVPYGCNVTRLHKLRFVEAAYEYPRGLIAGVAVPSSQTLNYVALGDSFSSGEGVEPFISGTDVDTVNECHRSELAYAKLLDEEPSHNISLKDGFAACSGAETDDVWSSRPIGDPGQWDGVAQVNELQASTNLVSLTIGGNDVGFRDFAEACSISGCDGDPKDAILAQINQTLPSKLTTVYTDIANKLDSVGSTAKVYVLGYPRLVKPGGEQLDAPLQCTQFTDLERDAVLEVTDRLNAVIAEAVTAAGSRFVFVPVNGTGSPFNNHELCMTNSYFNNANVNGNLEYSYHPNQYGQEAYSELLLSAIS